MSDEREAEIRDEFGLTEEQVAPRQIKLLIDRLVQAEQLVARAGSELADRAQQGADQATVRNTWPTLGGSPLHATAELAARFDYALVRLAERYEALALVAESIRDIR
ncbi:hypothetical protein [Couchioplanes caeruleus]|uniref:PE family protein n=2 Tax=Couchioplanes caeruleus TaxID=56438 RepID=A0A1K0FRE5_9ACTN|nr:hypothetical protein [Couchioplanes caeruleus]OJF15415.1 hypothetical protein BG844_04765 [Couchioplanes caeruleus subsp. caeruleus]ROP33458.1 hypothetical protein EDD30_6442 [Couchioplanes caeruleus]